MLRQAMEMIRQHQHSAPVQTVPLANALGLPVYKSSFGENDDISGMIRKEGGKYLIYVNKRHNANRRRFTIAHEIAHYILHKDAIGDGIIDDALYRSGLTSKMESEANRLAADILMPWHLMAEDEISGKSLQELAEKYDVSTAAMAIRLQIPVAALDDGFSHSRGATASQSLGG